MMRTATIFSVAKFQRTPRRILFHYLRSWICLGWLVAVSLSFAGPTIQNRRSIFDRIELKEQGQTSSILQGSEKDEKSYRTVPASEFCVTRPGDWKVLCPPLWNPKQSKDITLQWSCCDDPHAVARKLVQTVVTDYYSSVDNHVRLIETVAKSLFTFRDFCQEEIYESNSRQHRNFKARLVATRGSQGTKCPQWHVDHVPVRWIQTMVGPGCQVVVGEEGVNWERMNGWNLEEKDNDGEDVIDMPVIDRNRMLVNENIAEIYEATEQEALLLLGNRWKDYAKDKTIQHVLPVVHKSPTVPLGQARVLLTQDILLDQHET